MGGVNIEVVMHMLGQKVYGRYNTAPFAKICWESKTVLKKLSLLKKHKP